jgi:hypothetical protein
VSAAGLQLGALQFTPPQTAFSPALPFNGSWQLPAQSVVAAAGLPAFTFTAATSCIPGGGCGVLLTANGISNAPTFPNTWVNTAGSWVNTPGLVNFLSVQYDGTTFFYYFTNADTIIPTPTTFSASVNGSSITIGIGGASLDTSIVPPLSAFTLSAVRVAQAGQPGAEPAPYVLSSISLTSSSVVLGVSGGVFEASDVVSISYQVPFGDVTQEQASTPLTDGASNYVAAWSGAVVSI